MREFLLGLSYVLIIGVLLYFILRVWGAVWGLVW
jgi:hypothetical protein